jgi:hypothetical protein
MGCTLTVVALAYYGYVNLLGIGCILHSDKKELGKKLSEVEFFP